MNNIQTKETVYQNTAKHGLQKDILASRSYSTCQSVPLKNWVVWSVSKPLAVGNSTKRLTRSIQSGMMSHCGSSLSCADLGSIVGGNHFQKN